MRKEVVPDGFLIWHMNRMPHVVAKLPDAYAVQKWLQSNPDCVEGYYAVTGGFIPFESFR